LVIDDNTPKGEWPKGRMVDIDIDMTRDQLSGILVYKVPDQGCH
jgi:hypothetical protein